MPLGGLRSEEVRGSVRIEEERTLLLRPYLQEEGELSREKALTSAREKK